ncbi:MAG TPA: nitronate monooxygenase, partial [Terriglobales bacterium]
MWPDNRLINLLDIELPIIQAPMAGSAFSDLAVAVSEAGGLGSLACPLLSVEQARKELESIRRRTSHPINVNFFCHQQPSNDPARESSWRRRLDAYYIQLGVDANTLVPTSTRAAFDDKMCDLVMEFHPEVVSFHFGLPDKNLLERVRRAGAKIISSATSVDEARWLEDQGCDAIVAQGYEAGGHRGMFLTQEVSTQVGTMALVPQVVDAVKVPVIAAGGIADARGIAAAFALGAAGVLIGTAYLFCPEARISALYRQALKDAKDNETAITNVFTGRPARGIVNRLMREVGPMSDVVPEFPLAATALAPLRTKSEMAGSGDFSPLWSGQGARLNRELPAAELTKRLGAETLEKLRLLGTKASPDVFAQAAALAAPWPATS